jgi:hypothetical protein
MLRAAAAVLVVLAVRSFADPGALFDGSGSAVLGVKETASKPVPPPQSGDERRAAAPKPKQSGTDLYYFTPAEAAAAKKKYGIRDQSVPKGYVFDPAVPAAIQAQMKADLGFIRGIQGSGATPLHQEIFGSVDGPTYTRFFESRVTAIGLDDCGSANAVACVIPMMDPSKMWITQNYIKFSHPQIARLMVVFHESRHTETQNDNWPHETCPTPFVDQHGREIRSIWTGAQLAGEPACDKTPFGSYGSSTIMLKNVEKFCGNCTDKVKLDAGLYADDQIKRISNAEARKRMEGDFAR